MQPTPLYFGKSMKHLLHYIHSLPALHYGGFTAAQQRPENT